jgi:protein arginine kinase
VKPVQFHSTSAWLSDAGPHSDVVLSCRARLARNLAGFPFVNRASDAQRQEVVSIARQVVLSGEAGKGMIWVDLVQSSPRDRRLLVERHLISRPHAEAGIPRGVAISADESLSIMVNEEDHLRIQSLAPGLRLRDSFNALGAVHDALEARIDYAFSPRWGYLTACPTNLGTGIRFSVMMHLPALKLTNEIERVRRAAKDLHLAVRGYYGEGSESAGDFYQVSNQITLGRTEEELLEDFIQRIVPKVMEYERQARRVLVEKNLTLLDDRVFRAHGLLQSARLLGTEEAMKLLSRVRLGVYAGRLRDLSVETINRLFLQIQPGHLQLSAGAELSPEQLREARAGLVRSALR